MSPTMAKKKTGPKKDQHKPHRLVRIPLELYDQLRKVAERNKRPVSWEIRLILEEGVRAQLEESGETG